MTCITFKLICLLYTYLWYFSCSCADEFSPNIVLRPVPCVIDELLVTILVILYVGYIL